MFWSSSLLSSGFGGGGLFWSSSLLSGELLYSRPSSSNNESVVFPESAVLISGFSSFSEPFPEPPFSGFFPPLLANFDSDCTAEIAMAAPAGPAKKPGVEARLNPNIFLKNFSAGIINPIATIEYKMLVPAKSIAILINII